MYKLFDTLTYVCGKCVHINICFFLEKRIEVIDRLKASFSSDKLSQLLIYFTAKKLSAFYFQSKHIGVYRHQIIRNAGNPKIRLRISNELCAAQGCHSYYKLKIKPAQLEYNLEIVVCALESGCIFSIQNNIFYICQNRFLLSCKSFFCEFKICRIYLEHVVHRYKNISNRFCRIAICPQRFCLCVKVIEIRFYIKSVFS